MPLSQKNVDNIKARLPKLGVGVGVGVGDNNFANDPESQQYLDHYTINFLKEGFPVHHNFGYFDATEFRLACHIWTPLDGCKGTVFFQHGYTDNVGLMQHALRAMIDDGWAVVAFDLPGHGLSSGRIGCIGSFDQYRDCLEHCLALCEGHLPKPWAGAGQSTGAAIWLNYLRHHTGDGAVDTVIMYAPLVRIFNWSRLKFLFPVMRHFTTLKPRVFTRNSNDPKFLEFVRSRDLMQPRGTPMRWVAAMRDNIHAFLRAKNDDRPLKIISGDCDRTVDADWNLKMIKLKFPKSDITVIPGVRHQVVNESESLRKIIFKETLDWLNNFTLD